MHAARWPKGVGVGGGGREEVGACHGEEVIVPLCMLGRATAYPCKHPSKVPLAHSHPSLSSAWCLSQGPCCKAVWPCRHDDSTWASPACLLAAAADKHKLGKRLYLMRCRPGSFPERLLMVAFALQLAQQALSSCRPREATCVVAWLEAGLTSAVTQSPPACPSIYHSCAMQAMQRALWHALRASCRSARRWCTSSLCMK